MYNKILKLTNKFGVVFYNVCSKFCSEHTLKLIRENNKVVEDIMDKRGIK